MQRCEPFKEEAAEQAREHAHGQEEAGLQAIQRDRPATGRRRER